MQTNRKLSAERMETIARHLELEDEDYSDFNPNDNPQWKYVVDSAEVTESEAYMEAAGTMDADMTPIAERTTLGNRSRKNDRICCLPRRPNAAHVAHIDTNHFGEVKQHVVELRSHPFVRKRGTLVGAEKATGLLQKKHKADDK